MDLHPSCKYIASAGMDNVILLWDVNRQVPPNRLTGHKVSYFIYYRIKFMMLNSVLMEIYLYLHQAINH
jgi:hypothetical protein